jgi:hypothetical protein
VCFDFLHKFCLKHFFIVGGINLNIVINVFGPKRDEVTGEWRKLHHVELNALYCSSSYSSFCRAPVAKAPDVLQPCWLILLPLDVPTLTASRLQRS